MWPPTKNRDQRIRYFRSYLISQAEKSFIFSVISKNYTLISFPFHFNFNLRITCLPSIARTKSLEWDYFATIEQKLTNAHCYFLEGSSGIKIKQSKFCS